MQNNVMKMIYVNIKSPEIQNFEIFGIRERERERLGALTIAKEGRADASSPFKFWVPVTAQINSIHHILHKNEEEPN